jgi:hypothetical protein
MAEMKDSIKEVGVWFAGFLILYGLYNIFDKIFI